MSHTIRTNLTPVIDVFSCVLSFKGVFKMTYVRILPVASRNTCLFFYLSRLPLFTAEKLCTSARKFSHSKELWQGFVLCHHSSTCTKGCVAFRHLLSNCMLWFLGLKVCLIGVPRRSHLVLRATEHHIQLLQQSR